MNPYRHNAYVEPETIDFREPKGIVTRWWIVALAAIGGAAMLIGCPPTAQTAIDLGKAVACVLVHENEPPSQIAVDCSKEGVQLTVDVVDSILESHRAATARERAAGTLPGCDAGVDAGGR